MVAVLEKLRQVAAAALVSRPKAGDAIGRVQAEIASLRAALEQVKVEREAVAAELAAAPDQRDALLRALLLGGANRAEIAAHDRRVEELRDSAQALDLFESAQRRRLSDLEAERRDMVTAGYRARWQKSALALAAAMHKAAAMQAELVALVDEARSVGHEHNFASLFPPPPQLLSIELVTAWQRDIARSAPDWTPPPAPAARAPAAPRPAPAAPALVADNAPRAKRTRPPEPVAGGVKVLVLRNGFTDAAGVAADIGETIELPAAAAEAAVMAGAVEFAGKEA